MATEQNYIAANIFLALAKRKEFVEDIYRYGRFSRESLTLFERKSATSRLYFKAYILLGDGSRLVSNLQLGRLRISGFALLQIILVLEVGIHMITILMMSPFNTTTLLQILTTFLQYLFR